MAKGNWKKHEDIEDKILSVFQSKEGFISTNLVRKSLIDNGVKANYKTVKARLEDMHKEGSLSKRVSKGDRGNTVTLWGLIKTN